MRLAEPAERLAAPGSAMGRLARRAARGAGALIPASWVLSAMDCGSVSGFCRFLSWGFPIERPIRGQQRALHHAIYAPNTKMLQAALRGGADPNAPGEAGVTALGQALWQDRLDMAQALLGAGADPNLPEPSGESPLHRALLKCPSAVGPLLAAGADPMAIGKLVRLPDGWALSLELEMLFAAQGRSSALAREQAPLIAAEVERRELLAQPELQAAPARAGASGRRL